MSVKLVCCGDRRTVLGREGPVFAGMEFGGFFGIPHRVSIKNQLVMAFSGLESGIAEAPPAHRKWYIRNGRNRPIADLQEGHLTARSSHLNRLNWPPSGAYIGGSSMSCDTTYHR